MTDIEKIKKSIQNQIDQQERNYYKDLESKAKHADGTEMYKVDNHKIEALKVALKIIEMYE